MDLSKYKPIEVPVTKTEYKCPFCTKQDRWETSMVQHINEHAFTDIKAEIRHFGNECHLESKEQFDQFAKMYWAHNNTYPRGDTYGIKIVWDGPGKYACGEFESAYAYHDGDQLVQTYGKVR